MQKTNGGFSNMDVDTVSPKEMLDNFKLIEKNIPIMKDRLSKKLREKDGVLKSVDIEELIESSLDESGLAPAGRRILEGFYEIWMSIFMMVGNDKESLIIALRTIGIEI
ncbi:hypothetical protein EUAN_03370 [Andreesenia angusta]|uniref:Uncharacterized protein n=1 Tax=Andreesenia angusta TaxID=39480 RepID=A0A1S1VA28_9FIRM|nr:hypothetical protein [Andreesenia angusta]OHW63473.1 hypothetical protein EUAN_03370 [Andreesenia angusta]